MTGNMFGHYRIDDVIGRGGMGVVYQAFDTRHTRSVALKLLLPELVSNREFVSRFRRESEVAARLREPHVIPIHSFGEIDGQLYIDMRLVKGQDLFQLLRDSGPLTPAHAVAVVTQTASALEAAHDEQLIHRDVKPSNVLLADSRSLGEASFVYLVDFGIVRHVNDVNGLTARGWALGSLEYMAPERFVSSVIDHRVDVYALGCLLFESLTGRPPFVPNDQFGLINAHQFETPPRPSGHRDGISSALDEVVLRAMAKEPDDRYRSVAELAEAARSAMIRPAPLPPARTSTQWWEKLDDRGVGRF